jgi:hypothetical protein
MREIGGVGSLWFMLTRFDVVADVGLAGDIELLEAITPHPQVLPCRGRSKRTTSTKLHEWFLRGIIAHVLSRGLS